MNLSTNPFYSSLETRRSFLGKGTTGVGLAALAGLLNQDRALGKSIGDFTFPNFAPKAKRVVVLWQGGGPSHIDLLDPKPTLTKMAGKDIPNSVRGDTRLSTMSSSYKAWPCVPEIKPYKKYGQCGTEISSMLPNIGSHADDLCIVRKSQYGSGQPCSWCNLYAYGFPNTRTAKYGCLAHLWSRQRIRGLTRLCRNDLDRQG
jgi:hypothetical protein